MRKVFAGLAAVQLLVIVAQFFLAAGGAFDTAPMEESFQPHRKLGTVIVAVAILLTVAAAAARMPGRTIGTCGAVVGLAIAQFAIGGAAGAIGGTGGELVFGLHAVNGLAILAVTMRILRAARRTPARPAEPEQPARPDPRAS